MLFVLTGSAGSGKTSALGELSARRGDVALFDLDDLRPPLDADRSWWQEQIEAYVRRAVAEQAAGRDALLAGRIPLFPRIAHHLRVATPLEEYAEWVLHPQLPEQPTRPRSSYFVCGTPRSGSWLLCGLLASTGVAGRPHEWFWQDTEEANRRVWAVSGFSEYLARVLDAGTTANGVFGSKLMWAYLEDLLAQLSELGDGSSHTSLIERHFPLPRFVWIRREDIAAQAVSWAKAIQTGHWHHWDAPEPHVLPAYDGEQIDALAREAAAHDAGWRAWFAANKIEPLAVRFEDLVADTVGVTRAVLAFLGIAADGVTIAELTVRTGDRVNTEWLARYGT